jgi:hypothetical protein
MHFTLLDGPHGLLGDDTQQRLLLLAQPLASPDQSILGRLLRLSIAYIYLCSWWYLRVLGHELNRQRNFGIDGCNKEFQMQYIAVLCVQCV